MTAKSLPLVNQKLAYARAITQLLSRNNPSQDRLLTHALVDAAASHLFCGFRHYLHELAEINGIKQLAGITSIEILATQLGERDNIPAEVNELRWLQDDPTSWLAGLCNRYEQQWSAPQPRPTSPPPQDEDENLIQLAVIEEKPDSDGDSLAQINAWYEALYELIQRHRQNLAEY